jgi:hypothetical protein
MKKAIKVLRLGGTFDRADPLAVTPLAVLTRTNPRSNSAVQYGLCERRGCSQPKTDPSHRGHDLVCGALARLYSEAHALAEVIGTNDSTDQFLIAVLEMNKQYDRALQARNTIKKAALATGLTDTAWTQLLRGNYQFGSQPGQHTGDN